MPEAAPTPKRDIGLTRLYRRLERDTLTHLRQHSAEQAARIDELEAQVERLQRDLGNAEMAAEMWHQVAFDAAACHDLPIGVTRDGQVRIVTASEATA